MVDKEAEANPGDRTGGEKDKAVVHRTPGAAKKRNGPGALGMGQGALMLPEQGAQAAGENFGGDLRSGDASGIEGEQHGLSNAPLGRKEGGHYVPPMSERCRTEPSPSERCRRGFGSKRCRTDTAPTRYRSRRGAPILLRHRVGALSESERCSDTIPTQCRSRRGAPIPFRHSVGAGLERNINKFTFY